MLKKFEKWTFWLLLLCLGNAVPLAIPFAITINASDKITDPQPAQNSIVYKKYHNDRFQYEIDYPETLIPQGEATNGDGQRFISKDGKIEMAVYARYNVFEQNISQLFQEYLTLSSKERAVKITYKVLKKNFFVISGNKGSKIFYQKTILRDDIVQTFEIEYENREKSTYDNVVATIAKSFQ